MKNNYAKIKLCVVLLCFLVSRMSAQLSGIVTINSGLPTGGTNFQTWTAFTASLNAPAGVSGALTVNVQTGTSYTEQVIFNAIVGSSATNSIVINGNNTAITQTLGNTTSVGHTIRLNGTDYLTINNLIVIGQGSSYSWPLFLTNSADNNTFNNCTFSVQINQTSTNFIPVVCSGVATAYQGAGDFGDNNVWNGCTMTGGYAGISFYGNTAAPTATNNQVVNCNIIDFYTYGVFHYYSTDTKIRGCTFERLNRTTTGTPAAVYMVTGSLRCIVEKNKIRKFFDAQLASTATCYGILMGVSPGAGNENIFRNNIISDMRFQGPLYGINVNGTNNNIVAHNTISLDDQITSTTTNGTWGINSTATTNTFVNNIITISRTGAGTKYGIDFGTTATASAQVSNYNVICITATAGINNYARASTGAFTTLNAWKATFGGILDQQSTSTDPQIVGPTYAPLNVLVNNMCAPLPGTLAVVDDINNVMRSPSTPDPGATEVFNVPCSGPPAVYAVSTPTANLCALTPTYAMLPVFNYSNSGYAYQWQSSTVTPLGPWTTVPGATLGTLYTPSVTNVTTWYSVVVSCPGQGTTTSTSGAVNMVPATFSTIPYYESFETLEPQRLLPNCSWLVTNSLSALSQATTGTQGRVPRTGTKFAMFQNAAPGAAGTNVFYTNGLQLTAGVTYSAWAFYRNDGNNINWTELSMLIGPNQSAVSQTTVWTSGGPVVSAVYQQFGGTFMVPTTGTYYLGIRATSASGGAPYLAIDDINVKIPCELAVNSPTLTTSVISNTVCAGHPVTIFGGGADTYTWNTSENAAVITVTPPAADPSMGYTLTGTKANSGCMSTIIQTLNVYPSPVVAANAFPTQVCQGGTVNLLASGDAISYNWDNGLNGQSAIVQLPNTGTQMTYSVFGINAYGCDALAWVTVTINPLPNITVGANPTQICSGEQVIFTANGAQSYNWVSNTSVIYLGNPITLNPMSSAVFTVTGTDAKGCSNKAMYTLVVDPCTGLKNAAGIESLVKVYPNPNNGVFTIQTNTTAEKTIEVVDMTGRVVFTSVSSAEKAEVNMNGFAQGVYYLKVKSGASTEVVKIVRNN